MPTIVAFCEKCNTYVTIKLPDDILSRHTVFPFPYTYVHGSPPHALIVYLDRNLVERGHEVSDIDPSTLTTPDRGVEQTGDAPSRPSRSVMPAAGGVQSRRIVPRLTVDLNKQRLSINEFRVLNLCDGRRTIQEIADELGMQFFACMRILLDFRRRGFVTFEKRIHG